MVPRRPLCVTSLSDSLRSVSHALRNGPVSVRPSNSIDYTSSVGDAILLRVRPLTPYIVHVTVHEHEAVMLSCLDCVIAASVWGSVLDTSACPVWAVK